jgi:hypothetical protein
MYVWCVKGGDRGLVGDGDTSAPPQGGGGGGAAPPHNKSQEARRSKSKSKEQGLRAKQGGGGGLRVAGVEYGVCRVWGTGGASAHVAIEGPEAGTGELRSIGAGHERQTGNWDK